jgi:hypothetical protein
LAPILVAVWAAGVGDWKPCGVVSIMAAGGLQHEDNRFAQRRVGKVVAVFALAGASIALQSHSD